MRRSRMILGAAVAIAAIAAWGLLQRQAPLPLKTGAPIVSVTVPQLPGGLAQGEAAFDANCARCHGRNAAGQDGVAPPLVHRIYEPAHHGDMAFVMAARRGVRAHHWPFGDMPPVPDVTDEQLMQIVDYIRTLQRANGIF